MLSPDHIDERRSIYADAGVYFLTGSELIKNEKCVTRTDRLSGRKHDLLIEIIVIHLGTHRQFFSPTPVDGVPFHGRAWFLPVAKVTAMDLLRLLVRKEAYHPQARAATRNTLNQITREPERDHRDGDHPTN